MTQDAEWMRAFQTGDRDAFEKLVLRHEVGVLNFFLRMGARRAEAEDLTQEVFLRVYKAAARYEPSAQFTTWLYRIARNCWIDVQRKEGRAPVQVSADRPFSEDGTAIADILPYHGPMPGQRMERAETARLVEDAILALPETLRETFVLSEVQGMKYAEIADALDVPVGTVKSRMFTAVRTLRETLAAHGITG